MDYDEHQLPELLAIDLNRHFKQLVLYYQDRLFAFMLRLTGSSSDAQDILQEAFLGAYVTLSQYPKERIQTLKLRPWLYKLTLNIFRYSKRIRQLVLMPLDLSEGSTALDIQDTEEVRPDILFEDTERQQELEALVLTLPEHYQLVVTCHYLEELSYQEIADLLDQPIGTVKSRLHRGLQMLRHRLQIQERDSRYGTV